MTQKEKVLQYIDQHGQITNRAMMINLYINSPRDIIYELKKDGHKITHEDVRTPNNRYYRVYKMEADNV